MSTATTLEISSAFVNIMDVTVAFTEKATNTILPSGNVYIPPSSYNTTIQYSSNLKSLSNLGTSGIVARIPSGNFVTRAIDAGFGIVVENPNMAGGNPRISVDPSIIAAGQEVFNELLLGIDGATSVFTTTKTHAIGTVRLYYNGMRLPPTSFTSDGTSIHLGFVPLPGDYMVVDYRWT